MMLWVYLIVTATVFLFSFVILFGAPYVPTLSKQRKDALDLLDLKKGQTLLELGSGNGSVLIEAARRGIKSVGYELNPLLALYSWFATRRYGGLVRVKWANFWWVRFPQADGIYVFLHTRFMPRLYNKITQQNSNSVKLVSFAFKIPDVKHTTEKNGLYLYKIHNKK